MKNIFLVIFLLYPMNIYGWTGYDYDENSYVEIEKGELVREGKEIEIYDYEDHEYKNIEIDSMRKYGNHVEIEGTDTDTGEERTFEME